MTTDELSRIDRTIEVDASPDEVWPVLRGLESVELSKPRIDGGYLMVLAGGGMATMRWSDRGDRALLVIDDRPNPGATDVLLNEFATSSKWELRPLGKDDPSVVFDVPRPLSALAQRVGPEELRERRGRALMRVHEQYVAAMLDVPFPLPEGSDLDRAGVLVELELQRHTGVLGQVVGLRHPAGDADRPPDRDRGKGTAGVVLAEHVVAGQVQGGVGRVAGDATADR